VILLKVLSGNQAGAEKVARRFPVQVGRQPGAYLQLQDAGVWDGHFKIELKRSAGFILTPRPEAPLQINGEPLAEANALLRNGDTITAGSARIQFWLSPVRQRSRVLTEYAIWVGIGAVALAQVGLIYWLFRLGG
jgi:hypothetical protein